MNSNLAWFVVLLNLLAISAGLTYLAVKPAEIKAVLTVFDDERQRQESATPAPAEQTRPTGEVADTRADRTRPSEALPATGVEPAPADSSTLSAPPPRSTVAPPPRVGTIEPTGPTSLRATVEAEFVGPSTSPIRGDQPQPYLYPFRPIRRTFVDDETIEVAFLIGNYSGRIWSPAEVVLKSPGYPQSQVFRVPNWRLDEVAELRYRFPRAELERRMELLRVVEVRGTERQTARGEQVALDRESMMRNFSQQVGADQGLMRLITGAMGVQQQTNGEGPDQPVVGRGEGDRMEVFLPGSPTVASAKSATFDQDTEVRQRIASQWEEVLGAARTITSRADELAILIGTEGYEAAMAGRGKQAVLDIMDAKRTYDETGLDLALAVGRSNDPAVKQLQVTLNAISGEIMNVMTALENQLKSLDRTFSLGASS